MSTTATVKHEWFQDSGSCGDFETMMNNDAVAAHMKRAGALASKIEPVLYDFVYSDPA